MVVRACLLLLLLAPTTLADVSLSAGGCVGGTCNVGGLVPLPRPIQRRGQQVPAMAVRVASRYGNTRQYTTGSLLQGGWIVTCSHGLRTGWQVTVTFHDGRTLEIPKADVHIDDGNDMALLKVPISIATHYQAIPLEKPPSPGTNVAFAGFGGGRYGASNGHYVGVENDWLVFSGGQKIQHGDSGGPIYVPHGGLVAIISEVSSDGRTSEVRGCGAVRVLAFIDEIAAAAEAAHRKPAPETESESDDTEEYVAPEVDEAIEEPEDDVEESLPDTLDDESDDWESETEPDDSEITPDVDATDDSEAEADVDESEDTPSHESPIRDVAAAVVNSGTSFSAWTAVAAALGVSGPIGVGIGVAGWLISRRIKQRITERITPTDNHADVSGSHRRESRTDTTNTSSSDIYHTVTERIEKQPRFVKVTERDLLGEAYKEAVNREVEWQTASGRGAEWLTIGARIHDTAKRIAGRKKEPERSVTECRLGWSDN